jgi:hypothetical protein
MTNPGGMDEYFEAMSSPATGMELPPAATTYALADPALAMVTGERYGIKFLQPWRPPSCFHTTRGLGCHDTIGVVDERFSLVSCVNPEEHQESDETAIFSLECAGKLSPRAGGPAENEICLKLNEF